MNVPLARVCLSSDRFLTRAPLLLIYQLLDSFVKLRRGEQLSLWV